MKLGVFVLLWLIAALRFELKYNNKSNKHVVSVNLCVFSVVLSVIFCYTECHRGFTELHRGFLKLVTM